MLHRDRDRQLAEELVAACEAFLAGRYAEHVADRGGQVPPWAWVNLLAHGTAADLETAREAVTAGESSNAAPWRAARAFLAREVLEAATAAGTTLGELQRRVLVPLELELMGWPAALWDPRHVVLRVLAALRPRSPRAG